MKELKVFKDGYLAGKIREDRNGFSFRYDKYWVSQNRGPISESLPVDGSFSSGTAKSFFDNLLPEGRRREFYSSLHKTGVGDVFALLEQCGEDLAGSISVVENIPLPDTLDDISDEIAIRIKERETLDGIPGQKISLAGADNKTSVIIAGGGRCFQPTATNPSTHILKSSKSLSANEAFCMFLANRCDLDVMPSTLMSFGGEEAFLTERYDRAISGGSVVRLHQEDFCQFLGRPADDKYCTGHKGISNKDFGKVLAHLDHSDKTMFLLMEAYSLCIGNTDDHAKNYSVLHLDGKLHLAPAYDLVSVQGAKKLTREWAGVDTKLCRPFGKERDPYRIKPKDFLIHAEDLGVDLEQSIRIFVSMARTVLENLESAANEFLADTMQWTWNSPSRIKDTVNGLVPIIEKRTQHMLAVSTKALSEYFPDTPGPK